MIKNILVKISVNWSSVFICLILIYSSSTTFSNVVVFEIYMLCSAMNTKFFDIIIADLLSQKWIIVISYFSLISFNTFINQIICFVALLADIYSTSVDEYVTLSCFFDAYETWLKSKCVLGCNFMSSMLPARSLSQKSNNSISSFFLQLQNVYCSIDS
jgi:hypothetical protein